MLLSGGCWGSDLMSSQSSLLTRSLPIYRRMSLTWVGIEYIYKLRHQSRLSIFLVPSTRILPQFLLFHVLVPLGKTCFLSDPSVFACSPRKATERISKDRSDSRSPQLCDLMTHSENLENYSLFFI